MPRDVIAPFNQLGNREAAEAFSEPIVRLSDFTAAHIDSDGEFPPVPAYLSGICVAYLEDGITDDVRRQFLLLPKREESRETAAEAFLKGYKEKVQPIHEWRENAEKFMDLGSLALRTYQLAQQVGLRTVVAFESYSARDSGEHFTAIAIPKNIYSNIPLENRQQFMEFLNRMKELGVDIEHDFSAEEKQYVKEVLQNDPVSANFAIFAAVLGLPDYVDVERQVSEKLDTPGLTREQRRKILLEERRAARKNRRN